MAKNPEEVVSSPWTLENLYKLEEAIIQGALIVKYSDKTIEYRSLDEMLKIRDIIKKQLGLVGKTTRLKAEFSKGLC